MQVYCDHLLSKSSSPWRYVVAELLKIDTEASLYMSTERRQVPFVLHGRSRFGILFWLRIREKVVKGPIH
jgi:hypothetical protein